MTKPSKYMVLVLILLSSKLFAQTTATSSTLEGAAFSQTPSSLLDQNGKPVSSGRYIGMEGVPYLFEDFIPGKVVTDKGKIYDDVKLRYNAHDNLLSFIYNEKDEPLRFEEPIKQFTLFPTTPAITFVSGYPKIDHQNGASFYQVINYGKLTLLKFYRKEIRDSQNVTIAGIKGWYETLVSYYTYSGGQIQRFRPNQDNILKIMADKAPMVTTFINAEHIDLKEDNGLKKVFAYYNSL